VRTAIVSAEAQAAAAAKAKAAPKSDGNKAGVEGTILEDKPDVKWDDIAGLQVAKDQLMMAVVLPTKFPNMFSKDRPPPRGILLYGPPGTGKTHLARACAGASSSTFFHVKSSDIMSKFQGESEKSVANLFASAQERAPSIIFLDEVDSFFGKRDKEGVVDDKRAVKNTFLQCMENFTGANTPEKSLLVLAATNIPWELDEAFIRRFQAKIYIPPPDQEGRRYLIRQLLNETQHDLHEDDIDGLAEATRGYSGSDIKNLAQQAMMKPVVDLQRATHFQRQIVDNKILWVPCSPSDRDARQMRLLDVTEGEPFVRRVNAADFEAARLEVKTTIQEGTLEKLEDWTSKYGARA
jgi:vacuolar protein-sorting-associated protein 4